MKEQIPLLALTLAVVGIFGTLWGVGAYKLSNIPNGYEVQCADGSFLWGEYSKVYHAIGVVGLYELITTGEIHPEPWQEPTC